LVVKLSALLLKRALWQYTAFGIIPLGTTVYQVILSWKKNKKQSGTDIMKAEAQYRSCIL